VDPRPSLTLTVRAARAADAEALGRLLHQGLRDAPSAPCDRDELIVDPSELGVELLESAAEPGARLLVAALGQQILGMARVSPRELARARHVAVLGVLVVPGWRGRGIGGALVDELARRTFGGEGVERIEVPVASDDPALRRLVTGRGWLRERVERAGLCREGAMKDLSIYVRDR